MRIATVSQVAFAATMIGLGMLGLLRGDFPPIWQPVPKGVPAREAVIYLCAIVSLGSGIGLLWRRTAALAARLLLACLLLWLLLFRVPYIVRTPNVETSWAGCETAMMAAAAWVLYTWFATDWDRQRLGFANGGKGVQIARVLYGVALIPIGMAHFLYLQNTVRLVPGWLPWPVFWAYFTGWALIAAGVGVLIGVYAWPAAALSALEIGLFTLLVWVPVMAAGFQNDFQKNEAVVSVALTVAGWVVADSYRPVAGLPVRS